MREHYMVRLSEEERAQLQTLVGSGTAAARTIDWRLTTAGARIKLKHLYPVFED